MSGIVNLGGSTGRTSKKMPGGKQGVYKFLVKHPNVKELHSGYVFRAI